MSKFDALLNALRQRRESLNLRIQELRVQMDGLEKLLKTMEDLATSATAEVLEKLAEDLTPAFAVGKVARARPRGAVTPERIAEAAKEILAESPRPLKRGELVAALEARGVPVSGTNPNKNLGTILWRRRNEFVHLNNLGYWLADRELPQVYSPGQDRDHGDAT